MNKDDIRKLTVTDARSKLFQCVFYLQYSIMASVLRKLNACLCQCTMPQSHRQIWGRICYFFAAVFALPSYIFIIASTRTVPGSQPSELCDAGGCANPRAADVSCSVGLGFPSFVAFFVLFLDSEMDQQGCSFDIPLRRAIGSMKG